MKEPSLVAFTIDHSSGRGGLVPISSRHWARGRVHPGQGASPTQDLFGSTALEEARVPGDNPYMHRENTQTAC
ncbi:hypothetical protein AMECASPLE_005242 [Ameca splendens]|uniref:Uncharacterized protein n=1 Tax=Ameca splendens TaxID=208324 RepID=A0ABV0YL54_9TELE